MGDPALAFLDETIQILPVKANGAVAVFHGNNHAV
jgi:hypothetical protein